MKLYLPILLVLVGAQVAVAQNFPVNLPNGSSHFCNVNEKGKVDSGVIKRNKFKSDRKKIKRLKKKQREAKRASNLDLVKKYRKKIKKFKARINVCKDEAAKRKQEEDDPQQDEDEEEVPSVSFPEVDSVLQQHCASCHMGFHNAWQEFNSDQAWREARTVSGNLLINPDDLERSALLTRMRYYGGDSSTMPISNNNNSVEFTEEDYNKIRDWVLAGDSNNQDDPDPEPEDPPPPPPPPTPPPPPPLPPDPDLLVHYSFDDGSAKDLTDNGNDGVVHGADALDQALWFNGVNDYVDLQNLDVSGSALSISAWFQADVFLPEHSDNRIISKSTGTATQDHYFMVSAIRSGGENRLRFRLKTDGNTTTLVANSGNVEINNWYHVVAKYDGSWMRLYLNGNEVGSLRKTGSLTTNPSVQTFIGRNPGSNNRYWWGQIDEVRIYQKALSEAAITELFDAGPMGMPNDPNDPTAGFEGSKNLIEMHCTSCHLGYHLPWDELTTEDAWLTARTNGGEKLIDRDDLENSLLLRRMRYYGAANSNMPMRNNNATREFTQTDYNIIREWVLSLADNDQPNNPDDPNDIDPNTYGTTERAMYLLTKKNILRTLELHFGVLLDDLDFSAPSYSTSKNSHLAQVHTLGDFPNYFDSIDEMVSDNLDMFLSCSIANIRNDNCVQNSIETVGRLLYRRGLTGGEVADLVTLANSQGDENLEEGVRYAIARLFNAPQFLYQTFYGVNGTLTDSEIAARIAFVLLGANPDSELLDAADARSLSSASGISNQVNRILSTSESAGWLFSDFLTEVWKLNLIEETATAEFFKGELGVLGGHLQEQFERTTQQIYNTSSGDVRRLLDYDSTYVNRTLAEHYDLSPVPANDATWSLVQKPMDRQGVLTSGIVLASHSGNKYTSTTHRGLFIKSDLLCQEIPPGVGDLTELMNEVGLVFSDNDTVPERVEKLATTAPCSDCHRQFDPLGVVLENYDHFGRHFDIRYGLPVVNEAEFEGQTIQGAQELSEYLLQDEASLAECLFGHFFSYASGVSINIRDIELLNSHGLEGNDRYSFRDWVTALLTHPRFRAVENRE